MQGFRRFVQVQFFNILMVMLAGGFALLLAELLITEHTDGIQLVAVGAAVVGMVLTLAALLVRERAATVVAVLLVLLSVTGVIGAVEHLEATEESDVEARRFDVAGTQQVAFAADDDDRDAEGEGREGGEREGGEREGGEEEATPPPLAPLSLAGLSILGAVAVLGAPRKVA